MNSHIGIYSQHTDKQLNIKKEVVEEELYHLTKVLLNNYIWIHISTSKPPEAKICGFELQIISIVLTDDSPLKRGGGSGNTSIIPVTIQIGFRNPKTNNTILVGENKAVSGGYWPENDIVTSYGGEMDKVRNSFVFFLIFVLVGIEV